MIVSTFSMPTKGSASVRVAASIMPLRGQMATEWLDLDDGNTYAIVTHCDTYGDRVKRLLLGAHPNVAHISSVTA